jgi:A/G-specific adenine glycosylase
MDLGSFLKGRPGNPNTRSTSYSRQSPFRGSDRQVRGIILRHLLGSGEIGEEELGDLVSLEPGRVEHILAGLERDGFIERRRGRIRC